MRSAKPERIFYFKHILQLLSMVFSFNEFRNSPLSNSPHFLVIGHPISHSLSPVMHQTALQFYGMDAGYFAVDVAPDELPSFISWCYRDEFLGCNITIPYKELLMDLVDEIDLVAGRIGAINTIIKKTGKLVGSNTDAFGFTKPLEPFIQDNLIKNALIFGTGGASKAVKTALEEQGFGKIILVTRSASDRTIKSEYSEIIITDYSKWKTYAGEIDLFINTTPLGMHPHIKKSPVENTDGHLLANSICYDLIYNPLKTEFLKTAEKNNAKTISGLDMLIQQGSRSFEMWTGKTFPEEQVKEKLNRYFGI